MWSLLNPPKLNGPSTATVDHLTSSEKVHFRIAPMDNFGKLLAPFSAASDPVAVKSSSTKDEVNLVVLGVIGIVIELIVIGWVIILLVIVPLLLVILLLRLPPLLWLPLGDHP